MDNKDIVEAKTGEIKITDITASAMEMLLFYIYHDDLDEAMKGIVTQDTELPN